MKKIASILIILAFSLSLMAKPARPGFFPYTQPDGSTILIQQHGDEWGHWLTNASGQMVRADEDGFYRVVPAVEAAAIRQKAVEKRFDEIQAMGKEVVSALDSLVNDIETMVVGYMAMFISLNFLDFVINSARQSVQFIIISDRYEEIADEVNTRLNRGVTVLFGEGFYSKEKRQVLLILAKKHESRGIFQLIKRLDPRAFVSMSNVEGVFGEGFDVIKK